MRGVVLFLAFGFLLTSIDAAHKLGVLYANGYGIQQDAALA